MESTQKWDKIKGISGKIVRIKCEGEKEKRSELLSKTKHKKLYVGIDNNTLYCYYEIIG